ncbi:MAG: hypothetical protein AB7Y46_01185 [Armatimonadota bacterium]
MNMREVGWVWEGQGLDPGVDPSILGVGDGCRYFGLSRANYMFHPNTEFAMQHMAWLDEVTCDIAKWRYQDTQRGGSDHWVDSSPQTVRAEAALVSELSVRYPNITGAFHDDMLGLVRREGMNGEQYGQVYEAVKSANPALKLWVVVYTHELDAPEWAEFAPFMDVVNLWIWRSEELPDQDAQIARCRERFPGKPLVMGCYLRDYTLRAPVPMQMLRAQWDSVVRNLEAGTLDGFSILSANLIDGHLEQAAYIRDLIAAHS